MSLPSKGIQHVHTVFLGNFARNTCGDVGISVPVRANPAPGMEKGRTHGRHRSCSVSQLPVVKTTVHAGDHFKQCRVKEVQDGIRLFDWCRFFMRDWRSSKERVNFLKHAAFIFKTRNAAKLSALV